MQDIRLALTDTLTGQSSGKPIAMPVFAFTVPYTGSGTTFDKWNYSTVRVEDNLSPEDNTIVYTYIKQRQTGAGSTVYQFLAPATNWDASASPDWSPTITYIARPNCATGVGFMTNDKNTYPFPPNTNFDFERGLISKVINYNDAGKEVSESSYSYTRTNSPTVATGLAFEKNGTLTAYSKYAIYTGTSELTTQEVRKVYDSQTTPTLSQQTTTDNYFTGSTHKLLTRQQTTNSDGSVVNSYFKYTKDYTVSAGTDSAANGIYRLQQLNINAPVERYTQLTRGATTTTIGGQLTKFRTVNPTGSAYLYLPFQQLAFTGVDSTNADGISGFTASTVTSGTFTNDSHYMVVGNSLAYDFAGSLLSADDNFHHVNTAITDHNSGAAVASVANASYDEIGYNDFNSDTAPVNFTMGSYTYSGNSRTGQYSLSLPASTAMSRTVNKNALAKNYIFSIWINSTTSGSITITLASTPYTLSYTNGAGAWKYYELKMPVTSLASSFTAQFQSNQAILIDDVWFYPDVSEVSSAAFNPTTFQKTAQTNTNGVSQYYDYDMFNQLKHVYDQDKNIVERKTQYMPSSQYNLTGSISQSPDTIYTTTPVTFGITLVTSCLQDQVSASWDFGDGSSPITGMAPIHSYAATGTYTVTATITWPFFATSTISTTVTVVPVPPPTPSLIPLNYTNSLSDPGRGQITSLKFYNLTDLVNPVYTFTEATLTGGISILQGNYYVTFSVGTMHGLPLWNSLNFNNGADIGCWSRSSGSSGSITIDLSTSSLLNLNLNTGTCLL